MLHKTWCGDVISLSLAFLGITVGSTFIWVWHNVNRFRLKMVCECWSRHHRFQISMLSWVSNCCFASFHNGKESPNFTLVALLVSTFVPFTTSTILFYPLSREAWDQLLTADLHIMIDRYLIWLTGLSDRWLVMTPADFAKYFDWIKLSVAVVFNSLCYKWSDTLHFIIQISCDLDGLCNWRKWWH